MDAWKFLLVILACVHSVHSASKEQWRSRSIYQIVTDRFARSDNSTTAPCDPKKGQYCGGTFRGIIDRLDYIQDLGFSAVSRCYEAGFKEMFLGDQELSKLRAISLADLDISRHISYSTKHNGSLWYSFISCAAKGASLTCVQHIMDIGRKIFTRSIRSSALPTISKLLRKRFIRARWCVFSFSTQIAYIPRMNTLTLYGST